MPTRTSTTNYRRNRAQLLKDQPVCHWCKRRPATEADHLIEHDRGGSDELDNLVPSCKPCNGKRGQQYLDAKNRKRQQLRTNATKPFLDSEHPRPRAPSLALSQGNGEDRQARAPYLPRIETIVYGSVGTYGPDVADWAADNLNVELMPWQRHVLDQQLSFDADGNWCSPLALVSTARQNGKSICIQALIGWACTEYPKIKGGPVKVVSTAHQLNLAVAMFQELSPVLADKYGAKVKYSYGRNEIELPAAKWIVKAANPSAPHGLAGIDFLIVDEVWGISSETLDIGFLPTQRANPNPICSMWSTAGTEDSTCMIRHREAALRSLDTGEPSPIYLAEYSPPPDLDPMTPEAWIYANPALGHTITMKTLERESTAPNRAGFLRSSVNLWVQTDASWLQPGQWANCQTTQPPNPGGVIACEVSLDDGRYVAVRVNTNPDGQLTATVALMADTVASFWTAVRQQLDTNPGAQLAISPTLDTHCPTDLQRRRIIVGYQEIQRYTGAVKQMVHERRLAHTGETMLAEHIGRAVAVKTPGSIALSSNKSPGPIELARCLVWAAGIASKPTHTNNRPMLVTHNPRRVA